MQPIEAAGGEEVRHGPGTPFDQHTSQASRRQGIQDRTRVEKSPGSWQGDRLDVVRGSWPCSFMDDHDAARAIRSKDASAGAKSASGVDHDACRIRTRDAPHGELRVIGAHRAGADDDCIEEGSQAVQMIKSRWPVYVVRMAGKRGDASIDRLTDLADDHFSTPRGCPQWTEQALPWLRQHLPGANSMGDFGPRRPGVDG